MNAECVGTYPQTYSLRVWTTLVRKNLHQPVLRQVLLGKGMYAHDYALSFGKAIGRSSHQGGQTLWGSPPIGFNVTINPLCTPTLGWQCVINFAHCFLNGTNSRLLNVDTLVAHRVGHQPERLLGLALNWGHGPPSSSVGACTLTGNGALKGLGWSEGSEMFDCRHFDRCATGGSSHWEIAQVPAILRCKRSSGCDPVRGDLVFRADSRALRLGKTLRNSCLGLTSWSFPASLPRFSSI